MPTTSTTTISYQIHLIFLFCLFISHIMPLRIILFQFLYLQSFFYSTDLKSLITCMSLNISTIILNIGCRRIFIFLRIEIVCSIRKRIIRITYYNLFFSNTFNFYFSYSFLSYKIPFKYNYIFH